MDADGTLKAQIYTGTTAATQELIPASSFQADAWYVLLLVVDDQNGLWLSAWPRDDPTQRVEYRQSPPSFTQRSWRFAAWSNQGTLSLDEYSEGIVTGFTATAYDPEYAENDSVTKDELTWCSDLDIRWTPVTDTFSLSFEGGSLYLGKWSGMEYLKADEGTASTAA